VASPRNEPRDRHGADRFRVTLDELEQGIHVPAHQQVTSQPTERPPASSDEDDLHRQLRLAGGV
jgi:hypothetical protein